MLLVPHVLVKRTWKYSIFHLFRFRFRPGNTAACILLVEIRISQRHTQATLSALHAGIRDTTTTVARSGRKTEDNSYARVQSTRGI